MDVALVIVTVLVLIVVEHPACHAVRDILAAHDEKSGGN